MEEDWERAIRIRKETRAAIERINKIRKAAQILKQELAEEH